MNDANKLQLKLQEININQAEAESLNQNFMPFYTQVQSMQDDVRNILVESEDEKDKMILARKYRLQLKDIRVGTEKKRKELKEESLRKGKAIDGLANIVKFLIVPLEEHLQDQEDFVKKLESERKRKITTERESELRQYEVEVEFLNLGEMTEDAYLILSKNSKFAYEAKKAAEIQAEKDRVEKEKAERAENERIRKENEALKIANEIAEKDRVEKDRQLEIERIEREKDRMALEKVEAEKLKKEQVARQKVEDEKRKILEAQKAKQLETERIERERLQKIADEKAEAERIEKEKLLAPDKVKLEVLAGNILNIEMPDVTSKEAQNILAKTTEMLNGVVAFVKKQSLNL